MEGEQERISQANWQEAVKTRRGRRRAPIWPFILAGALLLAAILWGGIALFGQDAEEGAPIAAGGDQLRVSQGVIIEAEKARVERRHLSRTQELFWAGLLGVFAVVAAGIGILTYFHSDTKAEINQRFDRADRDRADLKAEMNRRLDEQKAETNRRLDEQKAETNRRFDEQKAETNRRFDEQKTEINRQFDEIKGLIRASNVRQQPQQ